MASHKDSGRDRNAGRKARERRRQIRPSMDHLEDRRLMAVPGSLPPTWVPTSTNLNDAHNGPLAKAGTDLVNIYHDYTTALAGGQSFSFTPADMKRFYTLGSSISVDINVYGNLVAYGKQAQALGMQVGAVDPKTGTLEGYVPVSQLPAIVGLSGTVGLSPGYLPYVQSVGIATNQGEVALAADKAKVQFGVDGTGVTIGVLSDSVSRVGGGLADSYKTGDLSAANPVTVLNDAPPPGPGQAPPEDEGRAMLEEIHDIAPGSKLLFNTAVGGQGVFAKNIRDLATAGANVIVDDIVYPIEPAFQDGIIATAVNDVSAAGVTYLAAVGNQGDSGYSSLFRGVTGTVPGVGTGRFLNFNPGSGPAALSIGINVYNPSNLTLMWDNPFYTTNGVTTELDIYVLDANNAIVASGTQNAIASQMPYQFAPGVAPGLLHVAIQVAAGSPDPGRLAFYDHGSGGFSVDHQYGSAGETSYPTAQGHAEANSALAVGAIAWFNAPAYFPGQATYYNEPFSSFGPNVSVFDANGTRRATPEVRQKPDITAVDGIDTSFFIPNFFLQTANPPFPQSSFPPYPGSTSNLKGELATPTELDNNKNPNFFGTSAAAPNLAAVVALMKQLNPSVTNAEIKSAFQTTALPLNGQAAGQFHPQAGFGLAQAPQALDAVNTFHVSATNPANNAGIANAPQFLIVTVSRDVDIRTLNANSLKFTAYSPPGLTISVGTPRVELSNLKVLFYPLTFNVAPGTKANGAYTFSIIPGSMLSTDGKPLQGYNGRFGVFDNVAPQVVATTANGRYVTVTFDKDMNPASFNKNNFYLIRTGGVNVPYGSPLNVVVNSDPRLKIGYDIASRTAVLDFSQLDQSGLPTDHYTIVVLDSVTDIVGNKLDGEFQVRPANPQLDNIFPSGDGKEGGNFTQDLGVRRLTAPQILSLGIDPSSDSGIVGDQNTNTVRPLFTGQVSSRFPSAAGGLTVVAEFNGVRGGTLDLGQGVGGRGFTGGVDVQTVTDASGKFSFRAPFDLPSGFQTVRVIVIGSSDQPPLPGLSTSLDAAFRIAINSPILLADPNSLQQNARVSSLTSVVIDAVAPVLPFDLGNPLSIPTQFIVPALDPSTATNTSNYSLTNLGSDNARGGTGSAADVDYSRYITSALYQDTSKRVTTADSYTGNITLMFAPGLPAGRYEVIAKRPTTSTSGITDAAGNGIFIITPQGGVAAQDFVLTFDLQPTPAYITSVQAVTPNPLGTVLDPDTTALLQGTVDLSGPRAFFELPVPGVAARATAAPTEFMIDFSNPLDTTKDYTNFVQLIASATTAGSQPDGDFGSDPTFQNSVGYTRVPNTSVKLINSIIGAKFGEPGYKNRLLLSLPAGTTLAADHYRLYIPNAVRSDGTDLRITDQFQNQLDGEFLGNLTPNGDGTYENLLPTGQIRPNDLTGDGVPGGAFETGYTVVPNGNVIFARPDYLENPNVSSTQPDGSPDKPYVALAPEATPNFLNGGDLNAQSNFTDPVQQNFDRNGNGHFDRSAFVAAAALSARGPVVIVAEPAISQKSLTFVLQAPSGTNTVFNDGSATVPFNTTLVLQPGSVIKFRNASLFVQNQGSAIQALGGANPQDQVIFTSFSDDSVGGDTNNDGNSSASAGGDWGGIVLRNFDDTSVRPNGLVNSVPVAPGPIDSLRPKLGFSGADETLSLLDHAQIRYAGGAVPQTIGFRYDAITNFNTRATISNVTISQTGGANSAQAAISGDVDSFREDDLARGILLRRAVLQNNSINGIYIRAELTGVAEPTDAVVHPDNPPSRGGTQNYTFFAPTPYVLVSRLVIGQSLVQNQNGQTLPNGDRFYFQPGTVVKFQTGAAIDEIMPPANQTPLRVPSLNIGDRTYINEYDANNNVASTDPGFRPATFGDAQVVFTSFFDDNATSGYRDPNTGVITPIVLPTDSDNGGPVNLPIAGVFPIPTAARWGGISVISGALAVIDEATFEFGGGSVNIVSGTIPQRDILAFQNANQSGRTDNPRGTKAYVTNSNFFDNLQAPISVDPNGLLATDPLRPLRSGNPFFRGNVLLRNQLNGLEVLPETPDAPGQTANVFANTIWDDTDITYILRATIRLGGSELRNHSFNGLPLPPMPSPTDPFLPELQPSITLTVQSSLPGTQLANGDTIARPGESAIIKLLNSSAPIGDGLIGMPISNVFSDLNGGAGFIAGADDGADPPTDPLIDSGYLSQIRFLGIGGNQTTGQQRVPVILTSVRDDKVGRTVRGTPQFQSSFGNTTAPAAGDGGIILFGALGLSSYNLFDPRSGSLIDNTDLKYLTRVEQQGGGWVYSTGNNLTDKIGARPEIQYNTAKAMTVSNSNFSNFSQVGFIAHPSGVAQLDAPAIARNAAGLRGPGTLTFFVNNTFSNNPQGIRIDGEQVGSDVPLESPSEAILLNNTFYNNGEGLHLESAISTGGNALAHVQVLAMDNIFANSTGVAINVNGQSYGSQGQYNLFSNNAADVTVTGGGEFPNSQPIAGLPQFRSPTTGDFSLLPNSDAIDSSRSEIGPLPLGTSLQPIVDNNFIRRSFGRTNPRGGRGTAALPGDIVSLPGYALRNYLDQFVPAIPGSAGALPGPVPSVGGSFAYMPISGERDQAGQLRVDDPNRANVGFGSRPFFDIGAQEYVQLNPPHILTVTAIIDNPTISPTNPVGPLNPPIIQVPFYSAGNTIGENQTPHQIIIQFDQRLDPATVNNKTITLTAAGGDGIFDNGNDRVIDLSGKLVYSADLRTVVINLPVGFLASDVYRLEVFGSGGNVIRNPQGLALDGENTVGGQPNAPTLPLIPASGDGFPGGNFFLPFLIDTHPPEVVGGSIALTTATDTAARDNITANNRPNFQGTVTDLAPPANYLLNQTIFIDVSTNGDGNFDRLGVATGKSDINGNFLAVFDAKQKPLADSLYNVGPDGVLGTADDSGYSVARVRVIDQSGNTSDPNDPKATISFVIDTQGPRVTSSDPLPGAQAGTTTGVIPISIAFSENIAPATLNANSIIVTRAGGDGIFGNGNDSPVAVDTSSIMLQNLMSSSGAEILRFNITGASFSDVYRVTLLGTGVNAVTDIAGNALDGEGSAFPSGDGKPGGDYNLTFIVFNPASSVNRFVGGAVLNPNGTIGNRDRPFATISAAIAVSQPGDTVAVLPGVYTETVALRSLVKLTSASPSSTNNQVFPGNALTTIIRAPANGAAATTTVTGDNLFSIPAFSTELTGFTIASPLVGDSARGPINGGSFALQLNNSDVLIDKDYFVDSNVGVGVNYGGQNAIVPRFESNGFIGNVLGLLLNDVSTTTFMNGRNVEVANNDFAFNTYGIFNLTNSSGGPILASITNNIVWENADHSGKRNGSGIYSNSPGRLSLIDNLIQGNGPSDALPGDDTLGVGGGFNPNLLSPRGDVFGNFTGNPAFVSPIDPRPDGSGPGNFFLGANFDLQSYSAAIDAAVNSAAPLRDFKNRTRVAIAGHNRPGYGPADVGAFEFNGGTGGGFVPRFVVAPPSGAAAPSTSAVTSPGAATTASTRTVAAHPAATSSTRAKLAHGHHHVPVATPFAAARRFFHKKGK